MSTILPTGTSLLPTHSGGMVAPSAMPRESSVFGFHVPQVPDSSQLLFDDGEPLETDWHRIEINLLIESLRYHWRQRADFYAGGNMFIYYRVEQTQGLKSRGPDFFLVNGVDGRRLRPGWVVWNEGGKYPDLIIELQSKTTAQVDLTEKKELYQNVFKTTDYLCYDPDSDTLQGWHLVDGVYQPLAMNDQGRLWCQSANLWLGPWAGSYMGFDAHWLRFYTSDGNLVQLAGEEQQAEVQRLQRELAQAQQEVARLKAESTREAKK